MSNPLEPTLKTVLTTESSWLVVLASLARDKRFLREMAPVIKADYFDQELHSLAAEAVLEHWGAHKTVIGRSDLLEGLATRLRKALRLKSDKDQDKLVLKPSEELVAKLFSINVIEGEGARAEALRFCRKREMTLAMREAEALMEKPEADADTVRPILQSAFRRVIAEQNTGIDFFPETETLLGRIGGITTKRISTGFKRLDRWMNGGMGPGTETVIMAPPKGGKSMTLLNMSMPSLLRGKTVVYFTHEISEAIIDLRYTARISGLRMKDIERDPKAQKRAIAARASFWDVHKPSLFIKGYGTKTATPETMRAYLYWLEGEHELRPDLVVIDYADIVRSTKQFGVDSERLIQADVYEQIRALAQEFEVPVLTASQCNRASVNKPIIRMEDISESFAKAAIADHLIAICQTPEETKKQMMRLFYAGSREGETGHAIRVMRNWHKCYLEELEISEETYDDRDA